MTAPDRAAGIRTIAAPRFLEDEWGHGSCRRPCLTRALMLFLAFSLFEEGCSSVSPVSGARAEAARAAYERARSAAWAPRRFKALFKAEVSPKVGAAGRGYLSVFWDGSTLVWRSSAPLAGAGRGGSLDRSGPVGGAQQVFPGKVAPGDVLASLLGAPDAGISASSPVEEKSGVVMLRLQDQARSVGIDPSGRIVLLSFPGGVDVRLQPGEGVPRRIEATGPDGRALLTLESFGAWPESEGVPPP